MIDVSQKDAKTYIEAFYANYPKVRIFYDSILENCKKNTYVETLLADEDISQRLMIETE